MKLKTVFIAGFPVLCSVIRVHGLDSQVNIEKRIAPEDVQTMVNALLAASGANTPEELQNLLTVADSKKDSVMALAQAFEAMKQPEVTTVSAEALRKSLVDPYPGGGLLPGSHESNNTSEFISPSEEGRASLDSERTVIVDRAHFEELAKKMRENADELVESLRNNAAVVVSDFVKVAELLEKQIRDKSDSLLRTVHISADELQSDNEKLSGAVEKIHNRQTSVSTKAPKLRTSKK